MGRRWILGQEWNSVPGKFKSTSWPRALADQGAAVQIALAAFTVPASVDDVVCRFLSSKKNRERVEELLDTLVSLGRARELNDGRFLAV